MGSEMHAIAAPFKTVFATSCEEVCKGPWDVVCFFQHLCVSNLIKFVLIAALCFSVSFFFLYLVCKFGVCKCIGKSMCKIMCWAPFATCFRASFAICRFLWRKLRNTKRVYRGGRYRRRHYFQQDLEAQYQSHSIHHHHHASSIRKRKPAVILKHFKRQRLD